MVHATAVEGLKGRRLRVGMIRGGRNAFIGAVHRMGHAARRLVRVEGGRQRRRLSLADGFLLPSVACVVIGGTSIFGGRGGYGGTIVGALILTVLTGLLTLLDVSEPIKQILYGAIILSLAAAYARLTE